MNTLGELKTAIASYLNREDTETLNQIPDMIRLAEADIFRELRVRDSEFTQTLTEADVPINPITLTDNFREMKLVLFNDRELRHVSDSEYYNVHLNGRGYAGEPTVYTIIDRQLYLAPWVDTDPGTWDPTTITIHYWGTESLLDAASWNVATNPASPLTPTPSDANSTRLLEIAPDLYLYGCLAQAEMFLQNDQRIPLWEAKYQQCLRSMRKEDFRSQFSGSSVGMRSAYGENNVYRRT